MSNLVEKSDLSRPGISNAEINEILNNIPDYQTRRAIEELIARQLLVTSPMLTETGDLITAGKYDDFVVDLFSGLVGGVSEPDFEDILDNVQGIAYANNTEEELMFSIQLPHTYQRGSDIYPHVHTLKIVEGNDGTFVWGLEYVVLPIGGTLPANTTTIKTTAQTLETGVHTFVPFPVIDGTNLEESTIIQCRLFRDVDNEGDTLDEDVFALSFDVHYLVNKLGTENQNPDDDYGV
jgi:hypothetical protein